MKRQITIYESAQNGKLTVFNDVECNTLAELKTLLSQKGISYAGMEFIEGVTNTKLISDESRIPDHIPFKGKYTDNVFINLLQKDSKIKSGVDYSELSRVELLHMAKPYADEIREEYGDNYTRVKSSDLAEFLENKDYENYGDEEEESEEYTESTHNAPHYPECTLTLENIAKAVKIISDAIEVNVDKYLCVKEESFFSMEDMEGFIRK